MSIQRMKLTGAAILVPRGMKVLQAAPAGELSRYVPMREPPELTHLRDTLPRTHAIEAFAHIHERHPEGEEELEAFIAEYVRDAYSDGVEDWSDFSRYQPVTRRSMDAPLGRKLRERGYRSLWDYVRRNGFSDLERLRTDLHLKRWRRLDSRVT